MTGCYDDVQDLLISVNGPDKHIWIVYVDRPDVMFVSVVCLSFEGVRIGEARHVYS